MRAVVAPEPGGPEALQIVERPDPQPGPGELAVRVVATAVNRGDILQRRGRYPPPRGASDVLGLELSGVIEAFGAGVEGTAYPQAPAGWKVGDEICALVTGGGYAEKAVVPAAVALPVPVGVSVVEAGGIVEVFATAYDNLVRRPRLARGETVLIHGGASGVGTAAIQLARSLECTVMVTAGSAERVEACKRLGAHHGVSYRGGDVAEEILALTDGRGVDVVLDVVGGATLDMNLHLLAPEGRLAVIGLQGGATGELNLGTVLAKRLTVLGSTLRARPIEAKAALMVELNEQVWPKFADTTVRPVIDRIMPLDDVADAHGVVERSEHVGKVLLSVDIAAG